MTGTRKKRGQSREYWKRLVLDNLNKKQRIGWSHKLGKSAYAWTKEQYRLAYNYPNGYLEGHIDWNKLRLVLNSKSKTASYIDNKGVSNTNNLEEAVPPIVRKVLKLDQIPNQHDVREMIGAEIAKEVNKRPDYFTVALQNNDNTIRRRINGHPHKKFEKALRFASYVDPDTGMKSNIMLVGPTGSGKSFLAEMVAEALGMRYSHISLSAGKSEATLIGRFLPLGEGGRFEFSDTEFTRFYRDGGIFCLEEIDSADANVLLSVNNALSNGTCCTNDPKNPVIKRNPDFICFSCANTWGTGANRMYVGRNQLDEATIDRFRMTRIEVEYDVKLEKKLGDKTICTWMHSLRHKIEKQRLRKVVSTRSILQATKMKKQGKITLSEIRENMLMGWTKEDLRKVDEIEEPDYFKTGV